MDQKLLIVYLLTFLLSFSFVKCKETKSDTNYKHVIESNNNKTRTVRSYNASDADNDLDMNDEEGTDSEPENLTFIDRLRLIHSEGKNKTVSKHVKHINETFALLKNMPKIFEPLIGIDSREKSKLIEFLTEIDTGLSPECFSAFLRINQAISNSDLWAIKCKFNF